jgi:hypothetical protein
MSEDSNPLAEPVEIRGMISDVEARLLASGEATDEAEAQRILEGIGATVLGIAEPEMALVITHDDDGNQVPLHYVNIGTKDRGTSVQS